MIQVGFTRVYTKKFNALEVDLHSEVAQKVAFSQIILAFRLIIK